MERCLLALILGRNLEALLLYTVLILCLEDSSFLLGKLCQDMADGVGWTDMVPNPTN